MMYERNDLYKLKDLPSDLCWICEKCLSPSNRHITPIGCKWRDYYNDLCPDLSRLIQRLKEKTNNDIFSEVTNG